MHECFCPFQSFNIRAYTFRTAKMYFECSLNKHQVAENQFLGFKSLSSFNKWISCRSHSSGYLLRSLLSDYSQCILSQFITSCCQYHLFLPVIAFFKSCKLLSKKLYLVAIIELRINERNDFFFYLIPFKWCYLQDWKESNQHLNVEHRDIQLSIVWYFYRK